MSRKLARVVQVDSISPIPKADLIVCARVGGWPVCVRPDQFAAGDRAVYIEIDAFLPEGNPHWQMLVDNAPTEYEGVRGHRLRSVKLRGQLSQGFLMPITGLPAHLQDAEVGTEVSEALGVSKYVKPLPAEIMEVATGYRPGYVKGTDLDRVQNLEADGLLSQKFEPHDGQPALFQVTEKAEGTSAHYVNHAEGLQAFSADVGFKDLPGVSRWELARKYDLAQRLASYPENFVISGELVGPGNEGNHYELKEHEFYLYRAIDVIDGRTLSTAEQAQLAKDLGIPHVPVLHEALPLGPETTAEDLQRLANGPSLINPKKRREGVVLVNLRTGDIMKVVSNAYLTNEKLRPDTPVLDWPL